MTTKKIAACLIILAAAALIFSACESKGKYDGCITSGCVRCHGGEGSPAPPFDTQGRSDTSLMSVGAHRAHLGSSDWHAELACGECHKVPSCLSDPGHTDSMLPAELTWGPTATADRASPRLDQSSGTCSGIYCHGATLIAGGTLTTPVWTTVDGSQAACGTCHGLPPDPPHPAEDQCSRCHGEVIGADGSFVSAALHINGTVNVASDSSCRTCHGNASNAAPPVDTSGGSATTLVTVGAHQQHLGPSGWHREVPCEECHVVPTSIESPGHIDAEHATLTWSDVATADGAAPAWDRTSAVCSGVYCHGTTLAPGGSLTQPEWTLVDGSQSACGTCHGLPPGGSHPAVTQCSQCHGDVVDSGGAFVDAALHINGEVDVGGQACDSCHGSAQNPAPPVDTQGHSDTSLPSVGAHQQHLAASDWHRQVVCEECHIVPASVGDPGHIDGSAQLTWSGVAVSDGASPSFDTSSAQCSGVYCHGTTLFSGGTLTQPVWTTVDGSQDACGTCHGLPPGGGHPTLEEEGCGDCHESVYGEGGFLNPALHINGTVNF